MWPNRRITLSPASPWAGPRLEASETVAYLPDGVGGHCSPWSPGPTKVRCHGPLHFGPRKNWEKLGVYWIHDTCMIIYLICIYIYICICVLYRHIQNYVWYYCGVMSATFGSFCSVFFPEPQLLHWSAFAKVFCRRSLPSVWPCWWVLSMLLAMVPWIAGFNCSVKQVVLKHWTKNPMNLLIPYILEAISCQLVDLIQGLSYHLQCFVFIPSASRIFHHSLSPSETQGTLVMASPETPTAPSGTVIWLMSTIGSQLGTVLASDIQNGISCPMLESWRKLGEFFGGGLDFLPWILQNPLFLGIQGDGSYPSRPVAEHCRQNAGRRPRWGSGNMFCQLLCTSSKAEAERFDRWRAIVDSHYIAVFEGPWFTVNDSSLWEEVFNCFVCSNLHFSIRSQILRSLERFLKSFWQS